MHKIVGIERFFGGFSVMRRVIWHPVTGSGG